MTKRVGLAAQVLLLIVISGGTATGDLVLKYDLSASANGSVTDDVPSLIYDPSTGGLTVEDASRPSPSLRGMFLTVAGTFTFSAPLNLPVDSFVLANDLSTNSKELAFSTFPTISNVFGDGFFLGNVLPSNLSRQQLENDVSVVWQRAEGGASVQFAGDFVVVPEPSAFLFLASALMITLGCTVVLKGRFTCFRGCFDRSAKQ